MSGLSAAGVRIVTQNVRIVTENVRIVTVNVRIVSHWSSPPIKSSSALAGCMMTYGEL